MYYLVAWLTGGNTGRTPDRRSTMLVPLGSISVSYGLLCQYASTRFKWVVLSLSKEEREEERKKILHKKKVLLSRAMSQQPLLASAVENAS